MATDKQQDMGNLRAEPGALYGKRTWRDLSAPRQRRLPDPSFDKKARGVVACWKANGGNGPYASRAIANAAQGLQFPLRQAHRDGCDAIDAGVPLRNVEEAAYLLLDEWRQRHARKFGASSDRPEPPTPNAPAMRPALFVTGESDKVAA